MLTISAGTYAIQNSHKLFEKQVVDRSASGAIDVSTVAKTWVNCVELQKDLVRLCNSVLIAANKGWDSSTWHMCLVWFYMLSSNLPHLKLPLKRERATWHHKRAINKALNSIHGESKCWLIQTNRNLEIES